MRFKHTTRAGLRYLGASALRLGHLVLIGSALLGALHADVTVSTAKYDFKKAAATPETNRLATVDAEKFLDPSKPDYGFQAAIDAVPASGGEVVLPEGEFVMRKGLVLRSGVRLRGQGAKTKLALPSPLISTKLVQPAKAGDRTLIVEDVSGFQAGMAVGVGMNGQMLHFFLTERESDKQNSVVSVKGNEIELSSPMSARAACKEGAIVANFFPMIFAIHASEIEVRDLEIIGRFDDKLKVHGDYSAAAIVFNDVTRTRICGVTVRGWKGDAFSLQCGENNLITECQAFDAVGRGAKGYHPGSVQNETIISRASAERCEGPGLFFCREVKFSVIGNGVFNNNGEMIGGFSAVYDHHNVSNRSYGENNKKGVYFGEGANHILLDNTLVNTGGIPVEFVGDKVMNVKPESPNWWPRNHVVSGNTIANESDSDMPLILIRRNTSACVVANNKYKPAGAAIQDDAPGLNVLGNNLPLEGPPPKPAVPPTPPAMPQRVVDAKDSYDPVKPDAGFQSAIDKAAAEGGTVRLPAGVYGLKVGLVLPSNVTLCGAGMSTVLLWEGTGPVVRSASSEGIGIRQLSIRQSPGNSAPGKGIEISKASGVLIESVQVDDIMGPGMELSQTKDVLISQSLVSQCETGYTISEPSGFTLAESWSRGNRADGLNISNAISDVVIDSSIFAANAGCGISVASSEDGQLSILSSVVTAAATTGMLLRDCVGSKVRGNIVHRLVPGNQKNPPTTTGIRLEGKSTGVKLTENLVNICFQAEEGTHYFAVEESDQADRNTIQWNVLLSYRGKLKSEGESVRLNGKKSVLTDNVLEPSPIMYLPEKR